MVRRNPLRGMACANALLLKIFLVVFLGTIELRCGYDLRDDRPLEDARLSERRHCLARFGYLCGVVEENSRAILRAVIGPLAIELRGVVALEENRQQLLVGNLVWIEFDLDRFGVAGRIRAHFLVRRILGVAADIADGRRGDALHLPERVLDAPETARCKCGLGHGANSLRY